MECSSFGVLVQPVATATARAGVVHYVLAMMFRHKAKPRRRDSHEALWFSDGTELGPHHKYARVLQEQLQEPQPIAVRGRSSSARQPPEVHP